MRAAGVGMMGRPGGAGRGRHGEDRAVAMKGKRVGLLLLAALLLAPAGCSSDDTARMARVGRLVGQKLSGLLSGGQVSRLAGLRALPVAHDLAGLEGRVRQRITADKMLAGQTVEVKAAGAQVELTGRVEDLAQRRRAVDLAESTLGVERVIDRLQEPAKGR